MKAAFSGYQELWIFFFRSVVVIAILPVRSWIILLKFDILHSGRVVHYVDWKICSHYWVRLRDISAQRFHVDSVFGEVVEMEALAMLWLAG